MLSHSAHGMLMRQVFLTVLKHIKRLELVVQTTLAERGGLVAMCCCVNAVGQALPPVYILTRIHQEPHMLKGAPNGSSGTAC